MFNCLIDVFDKFQTFFVGLLGFAGVIYTIRMNAMLERKQYERKLMNERTALRTALIAELKSICKTFEDRIDTFRNVKNLQSAFIPEYVSNKVYYQLLTFKYERFRQKLTTMIGSINRDKSIYTQGVPDKVCG